MSASTDRAALLLVDRHTSGSAALRDALRRYVENYLRSLGPGWHDGSAADIAARVRTAQQGIGSLTWQYLDTLSVTARGVFALPDWPRGVSPDEVWSRPFKTYAYQISLGRSHDEAAHAAVARALTIADDDLTLAMRKAAQEHASCAPGVTGLRRVVHPEMSAGGACGLCIAASDRVYSVQDLLPVHTHCRCTVAEVTKTSDPGSSLNALSLRDLYSAAGSTRSEDLKRTRYKVNEHGELGPVLSPKDGGWRGPEQVRSDRRDPPGDVRHRRLAALQQSIRALEERAAAGENVDAPLKYQRALLARLATTA